MPEAAWLNVLRLHQTSNASCCGWPAGKVWQATVGSLAAGTSYSDARPLRCAAWCRARQQPAAWTWFGGLRQAGQSCSLARRLGLPSQTRSTSCPRHRLGCCSGCGASSLGKGCQRATLMPFTRHLEAARKTGASKPAGRPSISLSSLLKRLLGTMAWMWLPPQRVPAPHSASCASSSSGSSRLRRGDWSRLALLARPLAPRRH